MTVLSPVSLTGMRTWMRAHTFFSNLELIHYICKSLTRKIHTHKLH